MEDLISELQPLVKLATSISEINSSMELLHNFSELNHQPLTSHVLDYFSNDFLNNTTSNNTQSSPYTTVEGGHHALFSSFDQANDGNFHFRHDANVKPTSELSETTSPTGFKSGSGGNDVTPKISGTVGKKRKRKADVEGEKAKEVIHVRAKRGQATDSHSLAERVRRERINEKLRVLQDLVPGCYKTMGMAVMLDVIINYVRSLQNQIEFLSMKLSAASMFYDFNSPEAEAIETLQRATSNGDVHGTERVARVGGYGEILPRLHSTWPF